MQTIITVILFSIFIFVLVKIIDMKFIQKEVKPLKTVVRDAFMVGISVAVACFSVMTLDKPVSMFFNAITEKQALNGQAAVFTDNPGF